jgi:TPP-dependent pyruvate/acetoin dehydrogenase alpha subunit
MTATLADLYRTMLRIRLVEEQIADAYTEQAMRCPVHLSIGQEACAAGVAAATDAGDVFLSGHRCHAHYLAKGGDLKAMIAELYGKETGCTSGKGGSMHLVDLSCGFLGAAPIVGSTIPIAVGTAFSARLRGLDRVTVVFFGEGATETGAFHESLMFAALHKAPVLFVCENNLYSVYSPMDVRQPPARDIGANARSLGVASRAGDGNDVDAVHAMAAGAVTAIRAGEGPVLLELATYRWREHCGPNYDNDIGYRTEAEFADWRDRCPLAVAEARLAGGGTDVSAMRAAVVRDIETEIADAFDFARKSPFPAQRTAFDPVYAQ